MKRFLIEGEFYAEDLDDAFLQTCHTFSHFALMRIDILQRHCWRRSV